MGIHDDCIIICYIRMLHTQGHFWELSLQFSFGCPFRTPPPRLLPLVRLGLHLLSSLVHSVDQGLVRIWCYHEIDQYWGVRRHS